VEARKPIHQADLPLTISDDGAYYLAEDLVANQAGVDMITVAAQSVTLDLNGFTIIGKSGVTAADCIQLQPSVTSFSLTNGIIRSCGQNGVVAPAGLVDLTLLIEQVQSIDNGAAGFSFGTGVHGVMSRCSAKNNIGQGILLAEGIVRDSIAHSNGSSGITVGNGLIHSCEARLNGGFNAIVVQGGLMIDTYAP